RVCSPAPPPRIPPQTFTKPNNNDQSTPRLHPNSTTTAAAAAAGYSHRCAPPSPPPSCHRRIVARCSAPPCCTRSGRAASTGRPPSTARPTRSTATRSAQAAAATRSPSPRRRRRWSRASTWPSTTTTSPYASSSPSHSSPPSCSSRSLSPRSCSTAAASSCAAGAGPRPRRSPATTATAEYRAGVGWGGDCAVCLGEFRDGELVRLLPRCSHPFHAPCIDTWLRAHVNCPLCRSPVVVPSDLPATATEGEAEGGGQAEEHQVFDEISLSESRADVSEDSDTSSDTQSEDTAASPEDGGRVMPKPIRRSASMDSPLFLVVVPEAQDDAMRGDRKFPNGQEMKLFSVKEKDATGTSSSSCQAGRFGIGRSMSSSGQGFFFSRNGRSSSAVLPL
ncbi:Os09g0468800, partial [Oryza sativa Japonica Group]